MIVQCCSGIIAGDYNCNYCIEQKRCETFKIAKKLTEKRKEDKNMCGDPNKVQIDWTKVNLAKITNSKKDKIRRIYEDDDFIIDLFPADQSVRVSIFKDGHFQDEVFVRKDDYIS